MQKAFKNQYSKWDESFLFSKMVFTGVCRIALGRITFKKCIYVSAATNKIRLLIKIGVFS